ncbi:MAG: hypothetical protein IIB58_10705 [Planctomycetes bacterium]|nr:hypothetical protein [Planctomycetota bacterium]
MATEPKNPDPPTTMTRLVTYGSPFTGRSRQAMIAAHGKNNSITAAPKASMAMR